MRMGNRVYRRRRSQLGIVLAAMVLMLLLGLAVLENAVRPVILSLAEKRLQSRALHAIHGAVLTELGGEIDYRDLMHIECTADGNVAWMAPRVQKIDMLVSRLNLAIQGAVESLARESLTVPLGQVAGGVLFAFMGPDVRVDIVSLGTAQVRVRETFDQAGVNQVKHSIYLDADCEMLLAIPFFRQTAVVTTSLPLAEAVIVGPVPSTYVTIGQIGEGR